MTLTTAVCHWTFSDNDGDSDRSTVRWTLNGTLVGTHTTYAGPKQRGDTLVCTVTPNDGDTAGTPVTATTTIDNTPPVINSAQLTPAAASKDTGLTCIAGPILDDDGDTSTLTYSW